MISLARNLRIRLLDASLTRRAREPTGLGARLLNGLVGPGLSPVTRIVVKRHFMGGQTDDTSLQSDLECAQLSCDAVYSPTEELNSRLKGQYQLIEKHLTDSKFDAHASSYLVVRSESVKSSVFVVFRGTQDLSDMIADFNCQPREIDDIEGLEDLLYVHGGIYETSKQSIKSIVEILNTQNESEPISDLFLTGHSLGGACAMAARFVLLQQSSNSTDSTLQSKRKARRLNFAPNFHVVTFGAPLIFSHGARKPEEEEADGDVVDKILKNPSMKIMQAVSPAAPFSRTPPFDRAPSYPAATRTPPLARKCAVRYGVQRPPRRRRGGIARLRHGPRCACMQHMPVNTSTQGKFDV